MRTSVRSAPQIVAGLRLGDLEARALGRAAAHPSRSAKLHRNTRGKPALPAIGERLVEQALAEAACRALRAPPGTSAAGPLPGSRVDERDRADHAIALLGDPEAARRRSGRSRQAAWRRRARRWCRVRTRARRARRAGARPCRGRRAAARGGCECHGGIGAHGRLQPGAARRSSLEQRELQEQRALQEVVEVVVGDQRDDGLAAGAAMHGEPFHVVDLEAGVRLQQNAARRCARRARSRWPAMRRRRILTPSVQRK